MSVIRQSTYAMMLMSSIGICNLSYAGCQTINDLNFTVDVASMLPKTATVTTTATSQATSNPLLNACTDLESLSIKYQMGQLADLSNQSIDINGRRFYKILPVSGINVPKVALDYLIEHAYVAFSIQALNKTVQVDVTQNSTLDIGSSNNWESVSVDLSDIHFYFDALPNKDEIVEQLNNQEINLKIGQLNIQLKDQNNSETWSPSVAPSLTMNITGIEFQRATCYVEEQNVELDSLVVTAVKAGVAVGNSKAFDVDLQCKGYLNQREVKLTWRDNNDLNNENNQGYLSSVKSASFSNVGVQVTDEKDKPIQIGKEYIFQDSFSGLQMKKSYHARYYLPDGQPTVGTVNAQAVLQITYD